MPISEYEWIVALAMTWRDPQQVAELAEWPHMERIESIGGQLGPNDWSGSNDETFSAACWR